MPDEEKKDFVIKDRRIFAEDESGEVEKDDPKAVKKGGATDIAEPEKKQGVDDSAKQTQLPEINFQTFIFSLNASALVQLGEIEDPASGRKDKNLPLAKQTIDILSMLEEKTAGNLAKDEAELMKHILYDLRMRYVKEKG
jgi:hypothetical protein